MVSRGAYKSMRVLVTVKTYPTPSQRHVETVCVAGIRLDTAQPSWVRLYPIPFRTMGNEDRFKKWQVVEVEARLRGSSDPRPESYSPNNATIKLGRVVDTKHHWQKRRELVGSLLGETTTCQLIAENRAVTMDVGARSLGLVKPNVTRVEALNYREWEPNQLTKVELASQGDLFTAPLKKLQPPPYRLRYHYKCEESACPGHKQEVIDWELGVSGMMWKKFYGQDTGEKIMEHWQSMVSPDKDTHFFIGNQHQYRHSFSVLGVWYPKKLKS